MTKKMLLETSVLLEVIHGNKRLEEKIDDEVLDGTEAHIDGISYYEVKRGLFQRSATKQIKIFEELCSKFNIILFDNLSILDEAAIIWADQKKIGKSISDGDSLIAGMAVNNNDYLFAIDGDYDKVAKLKKRLIRL